MERKNCKFNRNCKFMKQGKCTYFHQPCRNKELCIESQFYNCSFYHKQNQYPDKKYKEFCSGWATQGKQIFTKCFNGNIENEQIINNLKIIMDQEEIQQQNTATLLMEKEKKFSVWEEYINNEFFTENQGYPQEFFQKHNHLFPNQKSSSDLLQRIILREQEICTDIFKYIKNKLEYSSGAFIKLNVDFSQKNLLKFVTYFSQQQKISIDWVFFAKIQQNNNYNEKQLQSDIDEIFEKSFADYDNKYDKKKYSQKWEKEQKYIYESLSPDGKQFVDYKFQIIGNILKTTIARYSIYCLQLKKLKNNNTLVEEEKQIVKKMLGQALDFWRENEEKQKEQMKQLLQISDEEYDKTKLIINCIRPRKLKFVANLKEVYSQFSVCESETMLIKKKQDLQLFEWIQAQNGIENSLLDQILEKNKYFIEINKEFLEVEIKPLN